MASRSIRDSQRQKIYDAEDAVFDKYNPPEWASVHEVQEFVDYVTATDAWKALEVGNEKPISVRDGRGRRRPGADPLSDFITMPKWTRSRWAALHELAHIAENYRADWDDGWPYENENRLVILTHTTAPHGPEYAGIYLYLIHSFLSEEDHDRLKAAFKERKVKVAPVEVTVLYTEPEPDPVTDTDTQDRRCLQCGMVLVGSRSKFCSDKCRWTHHNHLRTERAEQSRQKICVVCGVEFRASRVDAKTCSPRCRQRLRRRSQ